MTTGASSAPVGEKRVGRNRQDGSPDYGAYMSGPLSRAIWPLLLPFSSFLVASILLFDLKTPFFRPDPAFARARRARSVKDGAVAPPGGLVLD